MGDKAVVIPYFFSDFFLSPYQQSLPFLFENFFGYQNQPVSG
jgi:hypothetical protein